MKRAIVLALGLVLSMTGSVFAANYALDFAGINGMTYDTGNDFVVVPDSNSLDLTTGLTIEAWIKPDIYRGLQTIVSKWRGNAPNSYIFKAYDDWRTTGELYFVTEGTSPNFVQYVYGNTDIPINSWTHVAATFDTTNGTRLFVNGIQDSIFSNTGTLNINDIALTIGCVYGSAGIPTQIFNGLIDEVRIWDYARTPQQLQDDMFYALTGNESGLRAYWNFNEGSGQVLGDLTSNLNHGRLGLTTGVDNNDPQWVLSDGQYGQVREVIPEPSSLLLLCSALFGAGFFRRKR